MIARLARRIPVRRLVRCVHEEVAQETAPKMFGGKHARESWELPTYIFLGGGMVMGAIGLWAQKNTSITTWAREKASKRLEN